jgi:hypothetical protein
MRAKNAHGIPLVPITPVTIVMLSHTLLSWNWLSVSLTLTQKLFLWAFINLSIFLKKYKIHLGLIATKSPCSWTFIRLQSRDTWLLDGDVGIFDEGVEVHIADVFGKESAEDVETRLSVYIHDGEDSLMKNGVAHVFANFGIGGNL